MLADSLEAHDGGDLGQVERPHAGFLRQGEDAFREARAQHVVDAALLRPKHDGVTDAERHVPRRVCTTDLDDPRRLAHQRQAALEAVVKVDARVRPVVEAWSPQIAIGWRQLRAAHVQGDPRRRCEAHAGADVASDSRPLEHEVQAGRSDDVGRAGCASVVLVTHRCSSRVALVCAFFVVTNGCRCGAPDEPVAAPLRHNDDLVKRRVPDTELLVGIPKGWQMEMPNPGSKPAPPPAGAPIVLNTRTLLSARPGTPAPGMLVTPLLLVLEDPWLPVGTTGVDYLVAQRAANQAVIGTNVRHVDAEPSRRQGRPSYHVRDEWNVKAPDGNDRVLSQEALLILDDAVAPDGSAGVHGYTVVITLEKAEFERMQPLVRDILDTVVFENRAGAKQGAGAVAPPTPPG